MIELSDLKAPGWQRVVSELTTPAPDDRAFLARLLAVMGQVSAARQGVLHAIVQREDGPNGPEARPDMVWPGAVGEAAARSVSVVGAGNVPGIEREADARQAALGAAGARQARVYGVEGDDQFYEGSRPFMVAIPVVLGNADAGGVPPVRGVVTLLIENRSRQALQTTLALLELLAGYTQTHGLTQALKRLRAASASLDLAGRLIASINNTTGFKACTIQLVNDLCRQLAVDRVALGWVHGSGAHTTDPSARRFCKVVALSDTENLDRRMAMVQKLEGALDECVDQEQAVLFPAPPEMDGAPADAVLSRAVTHAHRDLTAGNASLTVASIPLRVTDAKGERTVGAVLIETSKAGTIDPATVEWLQAMADLITPVLLVRRSDDRNLALRAVESARRTSAWLVGSTHTGWKVAGAALLVATLVSIFVRIPYRVGAPMELRPREVRTVSIPFDGILASLAPGVEAGKKVEKGDVLATLDTSLLVLQRTDAENEILRYEKEADEAMKQGDVGSAQQAQARAEQARARRARFEREIELATITAPISGTIISGDVKDKVRSSVKLGEPVFQVADLSEMVAHARVEDTDIGMMKIGQTGEIAPKSDPSRSIPVVVEQIVPLSEAVNGVNSFEVRAALKPRPGDVIAGFRPGLEGQARFDAERMSLLGIAGRRIVNQARMWLWW